MRVQSLFPALGEGFKVRGFEFCRSVAQLSEATNWSELRTPDRIPRKENSGVANIFSIAPDWTIEILSPDQSQTKVTKNILHCLKHGTQMGWLIDPEEQSVFVYWGDR